MCHCFGRGLGIRSNKPCIDAWCLSSLGFSWRSSGWCLLLWISLICFIDQPSPPGMLLVVHSGIVWVLSNAGLSSFLFFQGTLVSFFLIFGISWPLFSVTIAGIKYNGVLLFFIFFFSHHFPSHVREMWWRKEKKLVLLHPWCLSLSFVVFIVFQLCGRLVKRVVLTVHLLHVPQGATAWLTVWLTNWTVRWLTT